MTCVCGFTPAARNAAIALALGRRAVGVQGRTSRPGDRVVTRSGGHGLDVDVEGIERRAVVVLGHLVSRGGSWGNLRAAVDQRADRFFLQNIPTPPLHQAGRLSRPIAGASWGVYLFSPALPRSWRARRRPPWADSDPPAIPMQWPERANSSRSSRAWRTGHIRQKRTHVHCAGGALGVSCFTRRYWRQRHRVVPLAETG
jgi:hypothetical protein